MFKRSLACILAVLMIFAVGCSKEETPASSNAQTPTAPAAQETTSQSTDTTEPTTPPAELFFNPLTGTKELDSEDKANNRPVAISVNNYSENGNFSVQRVQSGLAAADIVYETEVEGSITRLLAVYQDATQAERVGSVRSARYQFIDLAMGHNAIFVHCGENIYAANHLKDISHVSVGGNYNSVGEYGAQRFELGLAQEHELFVWTSKLWSDLKAKGFKTTQTNKSWVNFADENENLMLSGGSALSVSVPFPKQTTKFVYDDATGLYTRYIGDAAQTDNFTKETTRVKNVFILSTSMSWYDDDYTRQVSLNSGNGYYITNGTMQRIKWSKGASSNGFTFTDAETGTEITVSAGNTWVCIVNKATCSPQIQ